MRRDQLMEPDFLSELLLFVIAAVMSFFLIFTGVFAFFRRERKDAKGTSHFPFRVDAPTICVFSAVFFGQSLDEMKNQS